MRRVRSSGRAVLFASMSLLTALAPTAASPRPDLEPKLPPEARSILGDHRLRTPFVDPIALCAPAEAGGPLQAIVRLAAAGELDTARRSLESHAALAEAMGAPWALLDASLAARAAAGREERRRARASLRSAVQGGGPELALACAELEAARLDLLLRRFPEAAATLDRAKQRLEAVESPRAGQISESADFYLAEALYHSRWVEEAEALYRRLSRSTSPRTAAAARLRLADIRFDAGERAEVLRDYETLLKRAEVFGASAGAWARRVSESAIAAGQFAVAAEWARRSLDGEPDEGVRSVLEIRLADIDAAQGNALACRNRLEQIEKRDAGEPVAVLAAVRQVDLGVDRRSKKAQLGRLRAATRSPHRSLVLYALGVLGHELRELGRGDEALAVLTRLAYDAPPAWLSPWLAEDLDAVLGEMARISRSEDDCLGLVRRLGGRYGLLAHHVEEIGPMLALGECYERLRLPGVAMQVYRVLARARGGEDSDALALPMARAALATGDLGLVRTAAAGHVRREKQRIDEWMLLLAEAERLDGKLERGAKLYRDLVRRRAPAGQRLPAILGFARTLRRVAPSTADAEVLAAALDALPEAERAADSAAYGEALVLAGDLEQRLGRVRRARALYGRAVARLSPGRLRVRAGYWQGSLATDPVAAMQAWGEAARPDAGGLWRDLAAFELRMGPLRAQLGTWPLPEGRSS